jgi:signal transduction histidine kinase
VSFRARLVLAAAYLVAVVVLALEIPLALNIERRADSDFQASVLARAALLSARVSDSVAAAQRGNAPIPTKLTEAVSSAGAASGERVVATDARGQILADSAREAFPGSRFATVERPEFGIALTEGRVDFRRRYSDTAGAELLLVTVPVLDHGQVVGAVRLSASRESVVDRVHSSWIRLGLIALAVVVGALVLAWILATTVARPLARLSETASRLGGGDLDARAATDGPKELAALGGSFNRMADGLATSLRAQRDFVANASHQLRTPLTGIKLRLEAIRAEGGSAAEDAARAEEEVDRLGSLVDDMLALAGASTAPQAAVPVDLHDIVGEAVERWRAPAADVEKSVGAGRRDNVRVFADPRDLAHVVDNLIENALRYSPAGAHVKVEASALDGRATLAVADDGPGIPAEDKARVFERFYRGTNGRQTGPGTGLGLAIVAELVERWGGETTLRDGPGTRVEAAFRRAAADR